MVGKAVGVLEDATTNHKAIDVRVVLVEGKSVSAIHNVTVDYEFCLRTEMVTEA